MSSGTRWLLFLKQCLNGLFMLFIVFNASAETVILDANESPPFWSENLPLQGLGGEIVQAISNAVGLQSSIRFLPLTRLIDNTHNNDLGNPLFYMMNQDFAAIIPIAVYRVSFFYYQPNHKETLTLSSLRNLESYKIGVLEGTVTEHNFFAKRNIVFETSYSRESLFKKLKHGRIDLVLAIDLVAIRTLSQMFPEQMQQFKQIRLPQSQSPLAIMIAEEQADAQTIAAKYRLGLQKIIDNGRYFQILEKYYQPFTPTDWLTDLLKFEQLYSFAADE